MSARPGRFIETLTTGWPRDRDFEHRVRPGVWRSDRGHVVAPAYGIHALDARRKAVTRVGWLRLLVVVGFILVIELLCRVGVIDPFTMIAPSAMVVAMARLIAAGKVGADLSFTLVNMAAAMALAIVIGFVMGSIIHALPRLRRIVDPLLGAYYAVPHFIFYPLLIRNVRARPRPAHCHWHHLRRGRHGRQHDRWPRSHPARFCQNGACLPSQSAAGSFSDQAARCGATSLYRRQAGGHLLHDRRCRGRIHPVDGRSRPQHRVRLQRSRQSDHVRIAAASARHHHLDQHRATRHGAGTYRRWGKR